MPYSQNDICRSETRNFSRERGRRFKTILGKKGEALALDFYLSKNHLIIAKNYRKQIGEIDLITITANTIHFIEIKTLSSNADSGSSSEKITYTKKQRMMSSAFLFIQEHDKFMHFQKKFILLEIKMNLQGAPSFLEFEIF